MELLEREQFFDELEIVLNGVAAGNGRVVLVSGDAGIGKTSLVEEFVQRHNANARVLWGACDALFTPRPLGPLYDIAAQIESDLHALLEQQAPRASIFSAVVDEIQKSKSPTIIVIEDVHWADEATLDLLKFLGRRIGRIKSMLITTYRDDEVGRDHPLRLVLGDLPSRSVARLRLPPLSEAGVHTLTERAGRRIDDIYEVTGGNPFFVTEALANKDGGIPSTVRDAVLSRAARLSAASRPVLEIVSVVPARTQMWLLADTISPDAASLEECVETGMLRYEADAIAFRHELARRAIEDALAAPRRQRLHALVLRSLTNRGPEALLARIVHHAGQAGDSEAVLNYAPAAARQAAALSAHREAASHYQIALQYAGGLTPDERAELFEHRSYECYLTDQCTDALQARREALKIWRQQGNPLREGDNLRWMSRINWYLGRRTDAEVFGNEAVTVLEKLQPGPQLAMAYSNRSQLHMLADDKEQAVEWGSRAIELAKSLGAAEILVHALTNVGTAEYHAGDDAGRIKLEESLSLALSNNFQEHAARAFTNLGAISVRARSYEVAMRHLDTGIAYTTEHDLSSWKLYMAAWRARAYFEQGDWDKAADDADSVLSAYRVSAITKICALAVLGHLRLRRGDPHDAGPLTEAAELAMQTRELQRVAPVASARAESAWFKGDLQAVVNEARLVLDMARGNGDPWVRGEFVFWMWRAGDAKGPAENIAAPYKLQMSGNWRAAADAWRQIGCPYEQAMALGDGDESAQKSALVIFERLGAVPAGERLRQTLRSTGARGIPRGPRPATRENPAGLTTRQMDVLALMGEGIGNAEIAERLFISTRTVDHHVSTILAKMDARTRAEAVSHAFQTGLIKQKKQR
jgi:ATP/maltotriose-dependent transcriptional regulator MalT